MTTGYYSEQAVRDLLAVKEGQIIFLANEQTKLSDKVEILENRIKYLQRILSP
jgi:hypothetical protein